MLDYTKIPLFEGLSKVDIAKLVPELEEVAVATGELLIRQGDPGDAMFIIRQGKMQAELEGPDGITPLETLGPGKIIGEIALLSGTPRTASVRALEPTDVWCLSRARLDALMLKYPGFAVHFNHLVGLRLANVSRHLATAKDSIATLSLMAWYRLSLEAQTALSQVSPLHRLEPEVVKRLTGRDYDALLAELESLHGLVYDEGRSRLKPALRAAAAAYFQERHGVEAYHDWARQVAQECMTHDDYGNAVEALLEAGESTEAAHILAVQGDALQAAWPAPVIADWVERCMHQNAGTLELWQLGGRAAEAAGHDERAIAFYSKALKHAEAIDDRVGYTTAAQALAPLHERRGSVHLARIYRTLVSEQQPERTGWTGRILSQLRRVVGQSNQPWTVRLRPLSAALGLLVGYLAWLAAPRLGMSIEADKVTAILAGAIVFWALDVAPDFVTALAACTIAFLWGAAPASVVFSGFSSSAFFLVLVLFAFTGLVTGSGLSFRAALLGMKVFPPTYAGQALALGLSGVLTTPLISSSTGRLSMVGPLVLAIKDALRLPDLSRASGGLALVAEMSYSQMSFLFLNGTSACFVVLSLLPGPVQADITWGSWFLSALPLAAMNLLGTLLVVLWRFRPGTPTQVDSRTLAAQLRTLGGISSQERLGLVGLALLLVAFILKPWHHTDPAWLAVLIITGLFVFGASRSMFKHVNYPFLLYFAAFVSLAEIVRATKADTTLAGLVAPSLTMLGSSPYVMLIQLYILAYLIGGFLPWLPTAIVVIASIPVATALGYNPFVVGLIILVATYTPGPVPSLLAVHVGYHTATERRAFTDAQVREFLLFQTPFILLGILISIPFWRMLHMVP